MFNSRLFPEKVIAMRSFRGRGHSKSTFVVQGGGSLKSELKRTRGGRGQAYLYVRSCEKNCLIFKQQAEFFLISCLAVAKCFLF